MLQIRLEVCRMISSFIARHTACSSCECLIVKGVKIYWNIAVIKCICVKQDNSYVLSGNTINGLLAKYD